MEALKQRPKISRRIARLAFSVLIIPTVLCLEHARRSRILVGTWHVVQEADKLSDDRLYFRFRRDGHGEMIFQDKWYRGVVPLTYEFNGLSQLKIISDFSFCDTDVVPLTAQCLESTPIERVNTLSPHIGYDTDNIYFGTEPYEVSGYRWHRDVLKPLQKKDIWRKRSETE